MIFRIVLALALSLAVGQAQTHRSLSKRYYKENLAPYVPSPQTVVDKMLEAAEIRPGEMLYDLGCGDGRIPITAARDYKAKGMCVELSDELVEKARREIARQGLEKSVSVWHGNLLEADLRPADIVTLYLLTSSNDLLKPILEKSLKPGARVVSHDFVMRGWKPQRIETVDAAGRTHMIYVYRMPPKKE